MPEFVTIDNVIMRAVVGDVQPRHGRLWMDDGGLHFASSPGAPGHTFDLAYADILTAAVFRESRDTVMVATNDMCRLLFCVLRPSAAVMVAGIIRLMKSKHARQAHQKQHPPPDSGDQTEP